MWFVRYIIVIWCLLSVFLSLYILAPQKYWLFLITTFRKKKDTRNNCCLTRHCWWRAHFIEANTIKRQTERKKKWHSIYLAGTPRTGHSHPLKKKGMRAETTDSIPRTTEVEQLDKLESSIHSKDPLDCLTGIFEWRHFNGSTFTIYYNDGWWMMDEE